jgi:hypothetical protein
MARAETKAKRDIRLSPKEPVAPRATKVSAPTYQKDPWTIREGESSKAYAAFYQFLRFGPNERSVVKAYNKIKNKSVKHAPQQWKDWSKEFEWHMRAKAYDEMVLLNELYKHQDRLEQARRKAYESVDEALEIYLSIMRGETTASAQRIRVLERVLDMGGLGKLIYPDAALGLDQETGKVVLYLPSNGREKIDNG